MKHTFTLTMLALITFLPVGVIAADGNSDLSLSGVVVDASGTTVSNATVLLRSESGLVMRTTSNQRGHFTFDGLSDASYSLTVTSAGFAPFEAEVVGLLGPTDIEVRLRGRGPEPTSNLKVPVLLPAIRQAQLDRWKNISLIPAYSYFAPHHIKASSIWDYRKNAYEQNWSLARLHREGSSQPVVWQYRISF